MLGTDITFDVQRGVCFWPTFDQLLRHLISTSWVLTAVIREHHTVSRHLISTSRLRKAVFTTHQTSFQGPYDVRLGCGKQCSQHPRRRCRHAVDITYGPPFFRRSCQGARASVHGSPVVGGAVVPFAESRAHSSNATLWMP